MDTFRGGGLCGLSRPRSLLVVAALTTLTGGAAGAQSGEPAVEGSRSVIALGAAEHYGEPDFPLNGSLVDVAATPSGEGYYLAGEDGGVFAYGDATFAGSMGSVPLRAPVVAIETYGDGYWLAAADGGVFSFGVPFHGSAADLDLAGPIVDMAVHPEGSGYWLYAEDGGVFAFGDVGFYGSDIYPVRLSEGLETGIAITPTSEGDGYWMTLSLGSIGAAGDAAVVQEEHDLGDGEEVIAVAGTTTGQPGFWSLTSSGDVIALDDAQDVGPAGLGAVALDGRSDDQVWVLFDGTR